jgi:hypothetical protein
MLYGRCKHTFLSWVREDVLSLRGLSIRQTNLSRLVHATPARSAEVTISLLVLCFRLKLLILILKEYFRRAFERGRHHASRMVCLYVRQ